MSKKRKEQVKRLADARLFAKRIVAIMLVAVMLMSGPYGYFTQYKGVNKRASDPYSIDVDAIISDKKEPSNSVIADFGMLEEKPLQLLSGKYGPYIKWGAKNCSLTADEKKDPSTITPERAREIALSAPDKKKSFRRKRS